MVQGYARAHAGINDFQARLIRSKRFHDVDLRFATKRKIANMPVMDFKIVLQLSEPPGRFSARGAHPEERSDEGPYKENAL